MPSLSEDDVYFGASPIDELRRTVNTGAYSPAGQQQNRNAFAEELAYMAPVSGEALSARDAWNASGEGGAALLDGRITEAVGHYINMATAAAGAVPLAGTLARGSRRVGQWMDDNLHPVVNAMTDLMPKDPASQTNIFAGPGAKTANPVALMRAQEMEQQGAHPGEVWKATGWGRGADGNWQFEIDDSAARIRPQALAMRDQHGGVEGPAGAMVDHPELFTAYPDLAKSQLRLYPDNPFTPELRGTYEPNRDRTTIFRTDPSEARSTGLHELQHGVQRREGWASGANAEAFSGIVEQDVSDARLIALMIKKGMKPSEAATKFKEISGRRASHQVMDIATSSDALTRPISAEDAYRRTAGEVQARNVQTRRNMPSDERRASPPWQTQDVPDDRQIVRNAFRDE